MGGEPYFPERLGVNIFSSPIMGMKFFYQPIRAVDLLPSILVPSTVKYMPNKYKRYALISIKRLTLALPRGEKWPSFSLIRYNFFLVSNLKNPHTYRKIATLQDPNLNFRNIGGSWKILRSCM